MTRKMYETIEDKEMFTRLRNKIDRMRRRKNTMSELYSLSDKELSDIGITRCDIERLVRNIV